MPRVFEDDGCFFMDVFGHHALSRKQITGDIHKHNSIEDTTRKYCSIPT